MTDQKMIASMVGDFYGVYLGKSMLGIQGLLKKYHNHKFIITLISNLETTVEIDMHKAMHEIYRKSLITQSYSRHYECTQKP